MISAQKRCRVWNSDHGVRSECHRDYNSFLVGVPFCFYPARAIIFVAETKNFMELTEVRDITSYSSEHLRVHLWHAFMGTIRFSRLQQLSSPSSCCLRLLSFLCNKKKGEAKNASLEDTSANSSGFPNAHITRQPQSRSDVKGGASASLTAESTKHPKEHPRRPSASAYNRFSVRVDISSDGVYTSMLSA
jgi:hypothetical protein